MGMVLDMVPVAYANQSGPSIAYKQKAVACIPEKSASLELLVGST